MRSYLAISTLLIVIALIGCSGGDPIVPNDTYRVLGINFSTPVMSLIAYSREVEINTGTSHDLFVMFPDGNYVNQLTFDKADDDHPSFSPDGLSIAFVSNRSQGYPWGAHDVYRLDGVEDVEQLTDETWQFDSLTTDWGGDFILANQLNHLVGGPFDVVRAIMLDPDGSSYDYLQSGHIASYDAAVTRNGKWVAFAARPAGATYFGSMELYLMRNDWDHAIQLTQFGSDPDNMVFSRNPSFDTKGRRLVFQTTLWGDDSEIAMMRLTNSTPYVQVIRLTDNDSQDVEPCFSPDGKWVAFVSDRDGNREIYKLRLTNANSEEPIRLTFTPDDEAHPDWSPAYGNLY